MMAQAVTGTPGHVNSMTESVGHFLKKFPAATMRAGDDYITNDPWLGTNASCTKARGWAWLRRSSPCSLAGPGAGRLDTARRGGKRRGRARDDRQVSPRIVNSIQNVKFGKRYNF